MNFTIIKENPVSSLEEVFNNLKHGGLKLLFYNSKMNNVSEVNYFPGGKIEIITIENDKVVGNYTCDFPFNTVVEMKTCGNRSFASKEGWFIGHIED